MSSKIEVERELLRRLSDPELHSTISNSEWLAVEAILATPVVERQSPECKCSAGMAVVPWLHAKHCPISCCAAPPELAELQATISELSKLLGQARGMVNGASDEWHNSVTKVLGHE